MDVALRGSVLLNGGSDNDLDLVFIVEEPDILDVERRLDHQDAAGSSGNWASASGWC